MRLPSLPWPEAAYRFDTSCASRESLASTAYEVFRSVWRTSLDEPGFALLRLTEVSSSLELRQAMFDLAEVMPEQFIPERLGRFDQQVTSKFHRDGAPPQSLLILGYGSSSVRSRMFVADAHRAAFESGFGITEFVAAFNPMLPEGAARLRPFVTELAIPPQESFIVVINNSLLPFVPGAANPLGVLHRADVPAPDPSTIRVINSVGMMPVATSDWNPKDATAISHFLTRQDLD